MAELTFKSPGVSTREIDLSGPTPIEPRGIPAGVIGTAVRGPAFVPVTVATFADFINKFGNTDGKKFGPLAMNEWLRSAGSGTYVRLLGVGDGKARNADGSVTNAGFIVGDDLPQPSGLVGDNPFAFADDGASGGLAGTMTLLVSDDAAVHGTTAKQSITLKKSGDAIGKKFVIVHGGDDGTESVNTGRVIEDGDASADGGTFSAPGDNAVIGGIAAKIGPGTGGVAANNILRFHGTPAAGQSFSINVPAAAGGQGTAITFKLVANAGGPTVGGDGTINITVDDVDGVNGRTDNLVKLVDAIIRGVDVNTISRANGGGNFASRDFAYATANAGQAGQAFGFTSSDVGADTLKITATNTTTHGNKIVITNGPGGDTNMLIGQNPGTPAGGNSGNVAFNDGDTVSPTGAIISQKDVLLALRDAINHSNGFGSDAGGITAAGSLTNGDTRLLLTQKTVGVAGNTGGNSDDIANLVAGSNDGVFNNATFAGGAAGISNPGSSVPGRTYFLGCFMKDAAGSTYLADSRGSGEHEGASSGQPVVRAVLMTPGGVIPALQSTTTANNDVSDTYGTRGVFGTVANEADAGAPIGDIDLVKGSKQEFVVLLNGHKNSDSSRNIISASFNPESPSYFVNKFNTDPTKLQEMGHYLYAHYDVYPQQAVPAKHATANASGGYGDGGNAAFLLSSSLDRNVGSAGTADVMGVPNYESFSDRFSTAFSPFVISQEFGGRNVNLFKFHALDDGAVGSGAYKITIENIKASDKPNTDFGSFDVLIRKFDDTDKEPFVLEAFRGLSLDHSSDRFIAKVIGDLNTHYDFDKKTGSQKLVVEGSYPNASSFVRVELSADLKNDRLDDAALPFGFRGIYHPVTSGIAANGSAVLSGGPYATGVTANHLSGAQIPPVPMRERISNGSGNKQILDSDLTWGVQFEVKKYPANPNSGKVIDSSIFSLVKMFPSFAKTTQAAWVGDNEGTPDVAGSILDADRFNNNKFTLERIQVLPSANGKPDRKQWPASRYSRTGVLAASLTDIDGESKNNHRFLQPSDLTDLVTQKYMKFTFPLQGGFDGLNIFDKEKSEMSNLAVRREMLDSNQGLASGATVASVRKAVDIMEEKSDVDIQLLAIPGMRDASVTDYAMESVERRFDALFLMDIEEYDAENTIITGSYVPISVTNTSNQFISRNLDSSFAAAYSPDVVISDPATKTNVKCPPSVVALGALSRNDALKAPWFAPAGYSRGNLESVVETCVKLNRANLDDLYSARINPITTFPSSQEAVIFGQKTLIAVESSLDRINVRRLLIDIRRKVRRAANGLLFEPNRASTLARFNSLCTDILSTVQQGQGVSKFKVNIDSSTTTQADIENNTLRGKIILQPIRSVEFISLDFVVTNAGAVI